MANVVIVGHSFTRRLSQWCAEHNQLNLNLENPRFRVFWHGISGATITKPNHAKSLWGELCVVSQLEAHIVFVDVGSNDLCTLSVTPQDLTRQLLSFAQDILAAGCRVVVIGEILHRFDNEVFNRKASEANTMLLEQCELLPGTYFWRHSRNNFNQRFLSDFAAPDGIHVDSGRGMRRYFSSVRGAIIFAERFI